MLRNEGNEGVAKRKEDYQTYPKFRRVLEINSLNPSHHNAF